MEKLSPHFMFLICGVEKKLKSWIYPITPFLSSPRIYAHGLKSGFKPTGLKYGPIFSTREVKEVLAEVNEFLIQLEAERNETGGNSDESFESEEDVNDQDTEDEKKDDDFKNDDVDTEVF